MLDSRYLHDMKMKNELLNKVSLSKLSCLFEDASSPPQIRRSEPCRPGLGMKSQYQFLALMSV